MGYKYGAPGNNVVLNNPNTSYQTNLGLEVNSLITVGRVVDIILDSSHDDYPTYGEAGIGLIKYQLIDAIPLNVGALSAVAIPLFSNIKTYPLINEIVYMISLPTILTQEQFGANTLYYFPPINVFNNNYLNALPSDQNPNTTSSPSEQKTYQEVDLGSNLIITNTTQSINLGNTFPIIDNIHPLKAFEGDVIYEGRFGHSIRYGSTVRGSSNNWSSTGSNGDPITIIRNGQGQVNTPFNWDRITEDVNRDDSSIYFTSTQNIPINVASSNYDSYSSYPPTIPSQYSGKQAILNSGRLVFNTTTDHIMMSSALTINFNAVKGFNFDTKANFVVNSPSIKLGGKNATEPILKGDTTINVLVDLVTQLQALTIALQTVTPTAGPAVSAAALQLAPKLTEIITSLKNTTKSQISKTL
tara:strand:+ start:97 stop:1338 length:1242 start_codon:yes stop_codon:yes gene_type:complete